MLKGILKMNNKGQSLVLFVLLLPILFLILYMVYEVGMMTLLKTELNNINYLALDYGVNNIEKDNIEDEIKNLILKNKSDIDNIMIEVNDNKVIIMLEDKLDNRISLIKNRNLFTVKSKYIGYLEDNKLVIKKDN